MKTNRVIFVDYDGVLNSPEFLIKAHMKPDKPLGEQCLDLIRVAYLSNMCSVCNAKVVLTSAWRDDLDARRLLKRAGVPVIGATPHKFGNRGEEIHQWLLDSKFDGEYVILDDEQSDYNATQRDRLVYTCEGFSNPTLGLQYKHILFAKSLFKDPFPSKVDDDFLTAILEHIEEELLRVMWNINQKEYDAKNPFRNSGNVEGFKNDTFEVHAYDWGWEEDENKKESQPINFKWRDFEVSWYKHLGRAMDWNRRITHDECAEMLTECLESLRKMDNENDNSGEEKG